MLTTFFSPVVGWASDNYGPRWFAVAGFILSVPFWVLLCLVTYNSREQKVLFFALLALPVVMAEKTYMDGSDLKVRMLRDTV